MKKKWIVALVVFFGISVFAWQIYQKILVSTKGFSRRNQDMRVAVEIAPVKKASIREVGSFTGSLHPFSEFLIAPKIAGRLESLQVHMGDTVSAGQLVAVMDTDESLQQVIQARAELEVTRANLEERINTLENAEKEYQRTLVLREKKIASESQLDAAVSEFKIQQAKLKVARAQISQKEAALKMAEIRVSYARIKVPGNSATGFVVGERFVDEGAMLAPNTPIVSILDIEKLIVVIHVIGRDYPKIQIGQEAVISTDAFPKETFRGKVVRLAPLLKETSREARVEIEMLNTQKHLKPGMFVTVKIQFTEHDNAQVVPLTALVKRNDSQGVFVVDTRENQARFIPVNLGIVNGQYAEVLSPVIPGSVVTLGHHLLEDGNSIILPDKKSAPEALWENKKQNRLENDSDKGNEKS